MLSKNSLAFIWHSFWLALAETFTDKNSVLPGLILLAGGYQSDIGVLTAIMIGFPLVSQILFTNFLITKSHKKKYLLSGIYLRVLSFWGVALTIMYIDKLPKEIFIYVLFFWMALFSISGAFAGISYNDLLGKTVAGNERKKFFVIKQLLTGTGILISAFVLKKLFDGYIYPDNYKYAFSLAGILLFIGTAGYFFIKEKPTKIVDSTSSVFNIIKSIPFHLKQNKNLRNLVVVSNLIGLTITITPFYIAFARNYFVLNNDMISGFLMYQIFGMIFSNFIWHYFIKKISFKGMLKISVFLYASIPILAIAIAGLKSLEIFSLVFLLVGTAISANRIAIDGAIIEISHEENRVLFTGIFGSLNLVSVIFPLMISMLISISSYQIVFLILPLFTLPAYFFVSNMHCPVDVK